MRIPSARPFLAALVLLSLVGSQQAQAYIGPGAGFALGGSMLVLATTFLLAFAIILTWPIRFAVKLFTVGNPYKNASAKRVIVLGFDGMDPGLATKFMREGRLPHFQKLAERGVFRPLDTSVPSMSPVAWSTFHRVHGYRRSLVCGGAAQRTWVSDGLLKRALGTSCY